MRTTIFSIAEMEWNVQQHTVRGLGQHPPRGARTEPVLSHQQGKSFAFSK